MRSLKLNLATLSIGLFSTFAVADGVFTLPAECYGVAYCGLIQECISHPEGQVGVLEDIQVIESNWNEFKRKLHTSHDDDNKKRVTSDIISLIDRSFENCDSKKWSLKVCKDYGIDNLMFITNNLGCVKE